MCYLGRKSFGWVSWEPSLALRWPQTPRYVKCCVWVMDCLFLHCFSCLALSTLRQLDSHNLRIELNPLSLLLHMTDASCPWKSYSKWLNCEERGRRKEGRMGEGEREGGKGKRDIKQVNNLYFKWINTIKLRMKKGENKNMFTLTVLLRLSPFSVSSSLRLLQFFKIRFNHRRYFSMSLSSKYSPRHHLDETFAKRQKTCIRVNLFILC